MEKRVAISNELVRSAYTLSLNEKRLVMYAVSQLKTDSSNERLVFPAIDCGRFYNMNESSSRRYMKAALNSLWDREVVTHDGIGHRWIISRGKYDDGKLLFKFHPDLQPHLFDLKACFTQYFLERAADFKLFYTWRLFEMLMQWRTTGFMTISVDELVEKLELTDYYTKDFGRIRTKIIDPAIAEMKKKADLDVKWKGTASKGRKIDRLEFKFPTEQQTALPLKKPASKPKPIVIDEGVADIEHFKKMAALADVPIETLLPKHLKEKLEKQKKAA